MQVLNEKKKKYRQIAMQNLVTGGKSEKSAARRFLKDIGLSDEAINKIEGKQKVEESETIEEAKKKAAKEKIAKMGTKGIKEVKKCATCGGSGSKTVKGVDVPCEKCGGSGNTTIKEDSLEECKCDMCANDKKAKCTKKKKAELKTEEEIKTGVNSVENAQNMLRAKKIGFDKTEKVGNRTIFKQGTTIVGAWDPSWGTVRTGEDLLKDQ